ncbi:hypothetical protein GCM10020331_081150 [Ectobacillus funiculus]
MKDITQRKKVVKVVGDTQNYKGRIQLKLKQIRLAQPHEAPDISDFVEKAPLTKEAMQEKKLHNTYLK